MASIKEIGLLPLLRRQVLSGDAGCVSDAQLLEWFVAHKDENAFAALLNRHGPMVMGVCTRVLHDVHDAEDAFQAAFLVLARKAASIVPRQLAANWLYGVAYRTALKLRSTRARANNAERRRQQKVKAMPPQTHTDDQLWNDLQPILDQELQRLPNVYRAAIVICDLEGKSRKVAARELGWLEGTLSGRLARARKLLAKRLAARGVSLSAAALCALLGERGAAAVIPATLKANLIQAALIAGHGKVVAVGVVSSRVASLAKRVAQAMFLEKLKLGLLGLVAIGMVLSSAGWLANHAAALGQLPPQPFVAQAISADIPSGQPAKADAGDAEMHVLGVYEAKTGPKKTIDVEIRQTGKPVVLVLTSYYFVNWNLKLSDNAQIKEIIVGGWEAQTVSGAPANVPIANYTSEQADGSRRKGSYFWAYDWHSPQCREMMRRLNSITNLPVASFQGEYSGASFLVDEKRGREFGQANLPKANLVVKDPTPQELLRACSGAQLHVLGIYSPRDSQFSKTVEVDVQATSKPVVLVLTSYMEAIWKLKLKPGVRLQALIVSGSFPQIVDGVPTGVPICHLCPDPEHFFFDSLGSQPPTSGFYAHKWHTIESRHMVDRLNDLTGLLLTSAQFQSERETSYTVDGVRGAELAQKERKPRPTLPAELKPQEFLRACAGANLHVVCGTGASSGELVDVEIKETEKPVVLALASYQSTLWNVKMAKGARLKAVVVGGYYEQEIEGVPKDVPIICRTAFPKFHSDFFYALKWNTIEYRRMIEILNNLTGLLVATSQIQLDGFSFTVDGSRGREFAQKERKPHKKMPRHLTTEELRSLSAGADLHVIGLYESGDGNGAPVEIEVRATNRPIVLALTSYMSILWKLKVAKDANLKAVIIGGYYEQEIEGIPDGIPVVFKTYFPSRNHDHFFGWEAEPSSNFSADYFKMLTQLKGLTKLEPMTIQRQYKGNAFVVDSIRGGEAARQDRQKAAQVRPAVEEAKANQDPLADVADIPSKELQAGGDANKRYFLIGPTKNTKPPAQGYGLVVILPGGDGSADFHPFVKRIFKNALPDGYLAVQPIAVNWTPNQQIVWPTKTNSVEKMSFTTEEFVDAVIDDVAKKNKIDPSRVFTLSWSSSGPAAYATSLRPSNKVKGSFIAMSVFNPKFLPALSEAKGHPYYLYHSQQDRVCPYRMAEQAQRDLTAAGASVHLETYEGGHGWRGNVYANIRKGIEWLEKNGKKKE